MAGKNGYVDGDGHIIESFADVAEYLDAPFTGVRSPRFLPGLDRFHTPSSRIIRKKPGAFTPADAQRWLEFQDKTGIAWSVLYPTDGLEYGRVVYPEWAVAYARGYNTLLSEKFLKVSPRLKGAALIPMQDVPSAIQELRRAVKDLGMVAAMIPSNGLNDHISSEKFWPIYEEAQRLDCALALHGGSYDNLGFNTFTVFPAARALGMPIPLMVGLTGLIVDGVLDTFPKLRVGFLEGGTAWIPLVIDRLRRELEYGGLELPKDPEDYFREGRLFVACEGNEESLAYVIKRIGHESVFFASDFPHEITMDNAMEEINEILERKDIEEEHKMAILADNANKFYKVDIPEEPGEAKPESQRA